MSSEANVLVTGGCSRLSDFSANFSIGQRSEPANRYTFPCKPAANPKAIVTGGKGSKYRFTVLTERLLRYEWSEDGGFEDRVSTVAPFRWFDAPKFEVVDKKGHLEIITRYFHLVYDKKEFCSTGLAVKVGKDTWNYDGKSYGDLGGTARTLDGADGRIQLEPGILSRKGFAVLDDSKSMIFDENGWIATRRPGRKDGYLFAYHGDHKAAIKDFYRLSGRQPLLPRWALGNWFSRYHAYTTDEYLEVMNGFKEHEIPLNVAVIDMDWHKVDIPAKYGSGWTGYSWNRDLIPDPEGLLKELHSRGLKVTVNDHPADGIRAFEDQYKEVAKALHHDTSHEEPIRFDCCDKKFLDAYFDVLKLNLEKQGIDFWWIDWQQGTRSRIPGIDPLWVLNHYHYLTSYRNVKALEQPLTFSRYAGAGSHRYPIGFSGDTVITWASLHFQPEFTATASNIGYGWWSHDLGGHFAGSRSNELTARWVQLGCFSPILRLHSEKSRWNSKEPWKYEPEAYKVMKMYLCIRHRLIPFLYTMNVRAAFESEPIVQPMYWNHKDDPPAYTVPNQYYFGPDLIVAPITTPHSPTTLLGGVRAWLPPGRYVDMLNSGMIYDGGRYVHVHRPLKQIPLFAREGTILPLDITPGMYKNGSRRPRDIDILLVVGADAHFELVEEPYRGTASHEQAFVRIPITWKQKEGILTIGPEQQQGGSSGIVGMVPTYLRRWNVTLVGCRMDSTRLQTIRTKYRGVEAVAMEAVTQIRKCNALTGPAGGGQEMRIALGEDLQLSVVDIPKRMHDMLYRCEMSYPLKEQVWQLVTQSNDPVEKRIQRLLDLNLPDALRDAVMEIWAADGRAVGNACGEEVWSTSEPCELTLGSSDFESEKAEDGYVLV